MGSEAVTHSGMKSCCIWVLRSMAFCIFATCRLFSSFKIANIMGFNSFSSSSSSPITS